MWAVLLVVGWACPLMADCFEASAHQTESSCHGSPDDSERTPEDCPYKLHKTSPAEGKFESAWDATTHSCLDADVLSATRVPAEQITPLMPPVIDGDYFHKLTVLLV